MFGTDVTVLSRVNRVVEDTRGARADNYLTGSARSPTTRPCSAHHAAASRAISPAAAGSTAGGTAALLIAASPVVAGTGISQSGGSRSLAVGGGGNCRSADLWMKRNEFKFIAAARGWNSIFREKRRGLPENSRVNLGFFAFCKKSVPIESPYLL